jgi:hypothetical protein
MEAAHSDREDQYHDLKQRLILSLTLQEILQEVIQDPKIHHDHNQGKLLQFQIHGIIKFQDK